MKKLIVLIPILVIFLCSCSIQANKNYEIVYNGEDKQRHHSSTSSSQKGDQSYTIAVVPKVEGIPYFNAVKAGAFEAGEDVGVKIIYEGPSAATWEEQAEVIEKFIEKDVDCIAVSANDPQKLGEVLEKAKNKGIHIITWDSDTNPEFRSFFVNMVDPEILGRRLMDALGEEVGGDGQFVIMTGSSTAANLNEWIQWIHVHKNEYYPKMEIVDIVPTNENFHEAYLTAQQLLEKYPNIKGIIGISSPNPPAAAQAIVDAEKVGKVHLVGVSTPDLMRSFIKDGVVESVTLWSPQKLGYLTVMLANNLVNGEMPYHGQQINKIGSIEFYNDIVIMGQPIDFTKENIDQYEF